MSDEHILFGTKNLKIGSFYKALRPVGSPEYRAAFALVVTREPDYGKLHPTHGYVWYLEGVHFGPFDERYEPAIPGERGERDPQDEVRVAYWWGNSNLYAPFTLARWRAALLDAQSNPINIAIPPEEEKGR